MDKFDFLDEHDKTVRRVWHKNEWWFVIEDIVSTFSSRDTSEFINRMKFEDTEFNKWYISSTCELEVGERNSKKEVCTNLEGFFRLVQSINMPKAEPFKLWLAKLGKIRIDALRREE